MNRTEKRAQERAERRVLTSPHWRRKLATVCAQDRRQYRAEPMREGQVVDLLTPAYSALDALVSGEGLEDHIGTLYIVAHMVRELAGLDYRNDDTDRVADDGAEALASAQDRFNRTKRAGLSGPELIAVRELLAMHDAQLAQQPARGEMMDALGRIRNQIEGAKA